MPTLVSVTARPRRISLLGVLLLLALGGCDILNPSGSESALYELSRRQAQWRARGIHDYSFEYREAAFASVMPARVEVRADTVDHVVNLLTGEVIPYEANYPTIDGVFARAAAVLSNKAYDAHIEYDAGLGFPRQIDANSQMPDLGFSLQVDHFLTWGVLIDAR